VWRRIWDFVKFLPKLRRLAAVLLFLAGLGFIGWTLGAHWFELWLGVSPDAKYMHAERASLVVCAISAGGAILFFGNALFVWRTGRSVDLQIPDEMDPILAAAVPIGVGILIGTTIFT
jgi:hypothetical protein